MIHPMRTNLVLQDSILNTIHKSTHVIYVLRIFLGSDQTRLIGNQLYLVLDSLKSPEMVST